MNHVSSAALAHGDHRLLIYGADPAASYLPQHLHVYCIFNPPVAGSQLCTRLTVCNFSNVLSDGAEAEAGGCRLEYFVFLAPGLLISACEHVEKKASSEALI